MLTVNEEWRDVQGYEGSYQVSNLGNVRSVTRIVIDKRGGQREWPSKILKQKESKSGYMIVHFRTSKESHPSVHTLVAKAFIPNQHKKPTVNHKDGDKKNNAVFNLEWYDHAEQMHHAFQNGLIKVRGKQIYNELLKKKIYEYFLNNSISIFQLAKMFNVSERTAGRIAKGKISRPVKISKESVQVIFEMRNQNHTLKEIADKIGCGTSQVHRILKGASRNESQT
jgi:transcriptional regulator with XRE-family HTH domain